MPPDPLNRGSRFLFERKFEFDSTDRLVRFQAFMPRLEDGRLELSVAETSEKTPEEIWGMGQIVRGTRPKTLKARAVFAKSFVETIDLEFHRDDLGFQGHANIIGWPTDEERQQDLAGTLAVNSELDLVPPPPPVTTSGE